jgi:hypothetical protein
MARTARQYRKSGGPEWLFEPGCLPPPFEIEPVPPEQSGDDAAVDDSKDERDDREIVGDTEEITDDDLIALVRRIPTGRRGAVKNLLTAFAGAEGETTTPEDTRLDRLQARYETRLEKIDLPEGGFTTKAELKAAERLAGTYRDLVEVQAKLRLPVTEKPERVKKAEALASAYRRNHDKTGAMIPVRPRGRPRRAAARELISSRPT